MPSYQDIEQRLEIVEDKLAFVMNSMRMAVKSGLIDQKVQHFTLMQLYLAAKAGQLQSQPPKSLLTSESL